MREGPHALDGASFAVKCQKVDRHFGRDAKHGTAVVVDIGQSPDFLGSVGGPAGNKRKLVAENGNGERLRAIGPFVREGRMRALFHFLHDRDLLDLTPLHVRFEPGVDVLQDHGRPVAGDTAILGQLRIAIHACCR